MNAVLSFLSHPRIRTLRRLPAPVVWITAAAVLLAQGFGPSFAGIAVSTYGSSATVHLSVLEWTDGLPTRVAAYLPNEAQPVVRTIDPDQLLGAVWADAGTDGPWRQGRVTVAGSPGAGTYDVAYRPTEAGLDAYAAPTDDPAAALHIQADGGGSVQAPEFIWPVLLALLTCALINDIQQQRCLDHAKSSCGAGNVKCANYTGGCGIGSCTVQCKGSPDNCD